MSKGKRQVLGRTTQGGMEWRMLSMDIETPRNRGPTPVMAWVEMALRCASGQIEEVSVLHVCPGA